jgi:hypothetical protein
MHLVQHGVSCLKRGGLMHCHDTENGRASWRVHMEAATFWLISFG